jgi:hypothetical protein
MAEAQQRRRGPRKGEGGAPKLPLPEDPDRYAVALALAFETLGLTRLRASRIAVALSYCKEIVPRAESKRRALEMQPALVAVGYKLLALPGLPATVDGKASTIRRKLEKGYSRDEAFWLKLMTWALLIALRSNDPILNKAQVKGYMATIGEDDFADACLVPMIEARHAQK